jgi:hypothetical protein
MRWARFASAVLFLTARSLAAAPPDAARLPRLCEKVDPLSAGEAVLVQSAQIWPSYDLVVDGVTYTIAVSRPESEVRYIATSDPGFQTDEGFTIDSVLGEILNAPSRLQHEPGWGYYVDLPSGWSAGFDFSKPPTEGTTVGWFFQRRSGYGKCFEDATEEYWAHGPIALLDHLHRIGQDQLPMFTVERERTDWVQESDLPALFDLVDSEEPCAHVVSVYSSYLPLGRSSIGQEALFMIEGFRQGRYPPGLHSEGFQKHRQEILEWWRERTAARSGTSATGTR